MRSFGTQRRVVAVTGIDHGVVGVDIEQPTCHVAEKFLERPGLPRFAHPAGEPRGVGEQHENLRPGYLDTRLCETIAV